jgi:hypothetical protein
MESVVPGVLSNGYPDTHIIDTNFGLLEKWLKELYEIVGVGQDISPESAIARLTALTLRVAELEAAGKADEDAGITTIDFTIDALEAHDKSIRDAANQRAVGIVRNYIFNHVGWYPFREANIDAILDGTDQSVDANEKVGTGAEKYAEKHPDGSVAVLFTQADLDAAVRTAVAETERRAAREIEILRESGPSDCTVWSNDAVSVLDQLQRRILNGGMAKSYSQEELDTMVAAALKADRKRCAGLVDRLLGRFPETMRPFTSELAEIKEHILNSDAVPGGKE